MPPEIAEELTKHFAADDLSPREVEVLKSIAGGRSNKIVADQLSISEEHPPKTGSKRQARCGPDRTKEGHFGKLTG